MDSFGMEEEIPCFIVLNENPVKASELSYLQLVLVNSPCFYRGFLLPSTSVSVDTLFWETVA
jgi:hypothetical protein